MNLTLEFPDIEPLDLEAAKPALREEVKRATFAVETRMKESMSGAKSGRVYVRVKRRGKSRTRKQHQASAPGEAPAVDSADLQGSIRSSFEQGGLAGVVSVGPKYGLFLELGTKRMEPRPFGAPALEFVRASFDAGVERALAL